MANAVGALVASLEVSSDILFYAFRYALGRSTYAVHDVAQTVMRHADSIDRNDREVMVREIREALEVDAAGMWPDRDQWSRVLDVLEGVGVSGG